MQKQKNEQQYKTNTDIYKATHINAKTSNFQA